jgi:hypothetical protein
LDLNRSEIPRFARNDTAKQWFATCEALPWKEFRVATSAGISPRYSVFEFRRKRSSNAV